MIFSLCVHIYPSRSFDLFFSYSFSMFNWKYNEHRMNTQTKLGCYCIHRLFMYQYVFFLLPLLARSPTLVLFSIVMNWRGTNMARIKRMRMRTRTAQKTESNNREKKYIAMYSGKYKTNNRKCGIGKAIFCYWFLRFNYYLNWNERLRE